MAERVILTRMNPREFLTYSFSKNVGSTDRLLRIGSGALMSTGAWLLGIPIWAQGALTILGIAWAATGIVSRCGLYYLFGYSTHPAGDAAPKAAYIRTKETDS